MGSLQLCNESVLVSLVQDTFRIARNRDTVGLGSPGMNSVTQEGNDIIHFNLMFRYVQYEMQCFFLIPADYVNMIRFE